MISQIKQALKPVYVALFASSRKRHSELSYWKQRFSAEGQTLSNAHYEPLYTTAFGLTRLDFAGRKVLDIGCGPRGSLEWADGAAQRVGLDPLVNDYLKLGATKHKMEYAAAPSENIPFGRGHFDIVTCLNALDHVDDFQKTVSEIKRVTKPGGLFLLSVEIDHPPTPTEPLTLTEGMLISSFAPEFEIQEDRRLGTPGDHNLHGAVLSGEPPYEVGEPGIYVARMTRR
jgi:ubiquinone/menaquinone biosynthesis C-methylase UbiE